MLNEIISKNQIKSENENKSEGLFIILMSGRPGVGKNTLVDLLSNSKRSMEGKGVIVRKYIARYFIKLYNISIYETPGFEFDSDDKTNKNFIRRIKCAFNKKEESNTFNFLFIKFPGKTRFLWLRKINIKSVNGK